MMRLKKRYLVPPDGFRFMVPETRHQVTATNWRDWIDKIKLHYRSNGLEIPSNIAEIAEHQLCRQLSPDNCDRAEKDAPQISTRLSLGELWSGVKAHVKGLVYGFVDQDEANRRAHICGGCYFNVNPQGCGACAQLGEFVTGDVARQTTKHDEELKACAVCKCPNKSIVHFPITLLEESDTPEKQALYPEFCWRQRQSSNYLAAA